MLQKSEFACSVITNLTKGLVIFDSERRKEGEPRIKGCDYYQLLPEHTTTTAEQSVFPRDMGAKQAKRLGSELLYLCITLKSVSDDTMKNQIKQCRTACGFIFFLSV